MTNDRKNPPDPDQISPEGHMKVVWISAGSVDSIISCFKLLFRVQTVKSTKVQYFCEVFVLTRVQSDLHAGPSDPVQDSSSSSARDVNHRCQQQLSGRS